MPPDSGGRDTILDTSAKLFSQHGYKEVSIRDIAQACGMTNAALYYHFKNKEDLFLAMLQRDHTKSLEALHEAAHGPGDLREDLKQLIVRYAELTCERRQSFQTLWRDVKQMEDIRARKLFGEMQHEIMRPLVERLEQAQIDGEIKSGETRLYARLLYGMINALTYGNRSDKPHKVPAHEVETVVEIFLKGVETQSR
ncbi:MAG TPA: TetR/AcrR family transcriptional regulator [Anaerolineae bacterium]|nr:TetR/AcrR family transcriptional regulator [Anaerolineae bacterium]